MALDIYVGTLSRYYSRQWETLGQQLARIQGVEYEGVRPESAPDTEEEADPEEVRGLVLDWRNGLSQGLKEYLPTGLDWSEDWSAGYVTDRPAWDCYSALILWAAYSEHPDLSKPEVAPENWTEDPAFQRAVGEGSATRYTHLLYGAEWWLPYDFEIVFQAPTPVGNVIQFGSSVQVRRQLDALNHRTWNADAQSVDEWHHAGADFGAPFEVSARFGFSVLHRMASVSVESGLPMVMDY